MQRVLAPEGSLDVGLLVLRIGAAICVGLALVLPHADASHILISQAGRAWPLAVLMAGALSVAMGIWTRPAAAALSVIWAWASFSGLDGGQVWYSLPIRADLFAIIYAALAVAGPGRHAIRSERLWKSAR